MNPGVVPSNFFFLFGVPLHLPSPAFVVWFNGSGLFPGTVTSEDTQLMSNFFSSLIQDPREGVFLHLQHKMEFARMGNYSFC